MTNIAQVLSSVMTAAIGFVEPMLSSVVNVVYVESVYEALW